MPDIWTMVQCYDVRSLKNDRWILIVIAKELKKIRGFIHRIFNGISYFIYSLNFKKFQLLFRDFHMKTFEKRKIWQSKNGD